MKYMKKKYKKGELAILILKCLLAVGGIAIVLSLPGIAPALAMFIPKNKYEKNRINGAVKRLEYNKFVEIEKHGSKKRIIVTGKGKRYAKEIILDEITIEKPKKWDGLWRVVIFDIPEPKRYARNALNRKLKELEFYPLQKSTFIFPYKCSEAVHFIRKYFDVEKYVSFLVVKEIEGSDMLKKHFGIK